MLLPPSTKLGKVIFSQASVILSTGGESAPGGVPGLGGAWSRGVPSLGGLPGRGCLALGGVPGPRGCLVETPLGRLLL